jgi:hypothetical protein
MTRVDEDLGAKIARHQNNVNADLIRNLQNASVKDDRHTTVENLQIRFDPAGSPQHSSARHTYPRDPERRRRLFNVRRRFCATASVVRVIGKNTLSPSMWQRCGLLVTGILKRCAALRAEASFVGFHASRNTASVRYFRGTEPEGVRFAGLLLLGCHLESLNARCGA